MSEAIDWRRENKQKSVQNDRPVGSNDLKLFKKASKNQKHVEHYHLNGLNKSKTEPMICPWGASDSLRHTELTVFLKPGIVAHFEYMKILEKVMLHQSKEEVLS